ncbi:MAG: glutathione S-transferase family protein [Pseudomonadota bacterium]
MTGYVLHGGGPSRSMLVEMVLAEAGAPYEVVEMDMRAGDHRASEFLALNPYGWIPALTTPGGETLAETPAINLWLCEEHGLDIVPPPGDPVRGRFLTAFHNVLGEIEPTMKRIFFAHRYTLRPEETEAHRAQAWQMLGDRLDPIEAQLAGAGPYLLGQRFSLADLTLAYWLAYADAEGVLDNRPALATLLSRTEARPALAPVFARHREWMKRLAVLRKPSSGDTDGS